MRRSDLAKYRPSLDIISTLPSWRAEIPSILGHMATGIVPPAKYRPSLDIISTLPSWRAEIPSILGHIRDGASLLRGGIEAGFFVGAAPRRERVAGDFVWLTAFCLMFRALCHMRMDAQKRPRQILSINGHMAAGVMHLSPNIIHNRDGASLLQGVSGRRRLYLCI